LEFGGRNNKFRIVRRSETDCGCRTQAHMRDFNTRYIDLIRTISLVALLAAGSSIHAIAGERSSSASASADTVATQSAQLSVAANAEQVRKLLQSQGYTNVSGLTRDANGRWTGTATKDGQQKIVSIALPTGRTAPSATN
jgi:hypothetical protein